MASNAVQLEAMIFTMIRGYGSDSRIVRMARNIGCGQTSGGIGTESKPFVVAGRRGSQSVDDNSHSGDSIREFARCSEAVLEKPSSDASSRSRFSHGQTPDLEDGHRVARE